MLKLYWAELGRDVLVWVFAVSALQKIRAPTAFAESLAQDFHVAEKLAKPAAVALFLAELLCLILLLLPAVRWGCVLAAVLLLLFSAAVARIVAAGEPVYCRCFGATQNPLSVLDLVRNLLYFGAAVYSGLVLSVAPASVNWRESLALALLAMLIFQVSLKLHEIRQLLERV